MGNQALPGYADVQGKHALFIGDHTGPASYVTGGESIKRKNLGLRSIDFLITADLDTTGTYTFYSYNLGTGLRDSWQVKWFVAATNLEVAAGTNLSGYKVRLFAYGG